MIKYLKAHNISQTGCVEDKRFKLKQRLVYNCYTDDQKNRMRSNVNSLVSGCENVFKMLQSQVLFDLPLEPRPLKKIRSYFMDFESCYRSANFNKTLVKRSGGKQLYDFGKVNVFDKIAMGSRARREYIPLPKKAKNASKFTVTADDLKCEPYPAEVMEVSQRYDQMLSARSGVLAFFWASNNFDINMYKDALEECSMRVHGTLYYANAMKLVRYLIPGMASYSLEELNAALGFESYDAHGALEDSYAGWRCLLFAVHTYLGADAELTEDSLYF